MRIIIETDDKQPAPRVNTMAETRSEAMAAPVSATKSTEAPPISAGAAPDDLLQALGRPSADATTKTTSLPGSLEAHADAMMGGSPPEWLVKAIESAHPSQPGKY